MIVKLDHIGIAVRSMDERLRFWNGALRLPIGETEIVETEGVRATFLPVGDTRLELLEPTREDSAISKFIAKRGEGINHLTLEVESLDRALEVVRAAGVDVVGEAPRPGAAGSRVAFLHPRSCGGVLVELVQKTRPTRDRDIVPGETVLAYLRDPAEKLWGVLRRLDGSGLVIEGIDLSSFDDWTAQIQQDEESIVGPSVLFVPIGRVERLLLDRSSGKLPSLAERFRNLTGRRVQDVLGE